MQTFRYVWLHIPTGSHGEGEVELVDRLAFLESLNNWNKRGIGQWQYAEA